MIKLENVVLASPEQMDFIIQGMRNPLNSWSKSDSENKLMNQDDYELGYEPNYEYIVGENDLGLMNRLAKAGTDHRKFMRMMPVYVKITAPLYWWKEFDTYKVGTVSNSCSTMHKIAEKEFELKDFSRDHMCLKSINMLKVIVSELNFWRDAYISKSDEERCAFFAKSKWYDTYIPTKKECWWQMIQLLPSSYNQTRNVMLNYEVLANIYKSRKNHKLDEWQEFCKWIEQLPYSELIIGNNTTTEQSKERTDDINKILNDIYKRYEGYEKYIVCSSLKYNSLYILLETNNLYEAIAFTDKLASNATTKYIRKNFGDDFIEYNCGEFNKSYKIKCINKKEKINEN